MSQSAKDHTKESPWPWFIGEMAGTFLLVFFGCGSVCAAILHGAQVGIFQVAIVWGIGIALAIHLTASLSGAHLNPAITLAAACWAGFSRRKVIPYLAAQMLGAFAAAAILHLVFAQSLASFEQANGIVRGQPGSEASAMVFAEYFPNPGGHPLAVGHTAAISIGQAFTVEVVGTGILALVIFGLTDPRNRERPTFLAPALIGLTVTLLISLFGPLTMACFNPARDLAPRLYSSLAGWGSIPFLTNGSGWLVVYVIAPILGALIGAGIWKTVLAPQYRLRHEELV
ncbi:MAG: MIP/aquaporin family protein [Chthoniobacteraceae bacterium]